MALLFASDTFGPMPDVAIFADTQSEPATVYDMLEYLDAQTPFPIETVTAGSVLEHIADPPSNYVAIPAHVRMNNGRTTLGRRQCTRQFKLLPIEARVRQHLGLEPRQWWPKHPVASALIGITVDEVERCSPNRTAPQAIKNVYPYIANGWTRDDCRDWYAEHHPSGPPLARSACICCPLRNRDDWAELTPEEVNRASEAEYAMIEATRIQYLHYSGKPLRVALSNTDEQPELPFDQCDAQSGCFL